MINKQEVFRRNCLARYMLRNWERGKILEWLAKNKSISADMKQRLNEERLRTPKKLLKNAKDRPLLTL